MIHIDICVWINISSIGKAFISGTEQAIESELDHGN